MDKALIEDFGANTIADERMNKALVNKWAPMLEGIKDAQHQKILSRMYENQVQHLRAKSGGLMEQTKSGDVGAFTKFIFPILRRVFPNLIAPDIVSVQPMSAPVGAVFYFDLVYATNKGSVAAGDLLARDFNRYYSSEYVDGELVGAGTGSQTVFNANLAFTPIRSDVGFISKTRLKVTYTISAVAYEGFADVAGAITGTGITSGSVNYNSGAITITFATAPDTATVVNAYYEYLGEANAQVPQANLQVSLQEVRAYSRKLKALTSSEAVEDLRAFHGLDADDELVAHIADEIALEIDREILTDLISQATGGYTTWDRAVPSGMEEVAHIRTFITKLSEVSNAIHKASLRMAANWVVISPEMASVLEQLQTHADFKHNVEGGIDPGLPLPRGHFGIYPMGTLKNRWRVYVDPYMAPTGKVLVGFKGRSWMDAGYSYSPYIPLQVTAPFLDPADFVIRKGFRTRYATKMLRTEYYGTLDVTNL